MTRSLEREAWSLFIRQKLISEMKVVGLSVFHHRSGLHGYGVFVGRRKPWSEDEVARMKRALPA